MLRNRITYAAVLSVLFVFIYLREDNMTYAAFYAALILPVFSFVFLQFTRFNIEITEKLSNEIVAKNEEFLYRVKVRNRGFLPCFFIRLSFDFKNLGLDSTTQNSYFAVGGKNHFEDEIKISGKYRGIYEIGMKEVAMYDFLGIFKAKIKYANTLKLTITPEIKHIPELVTNQIQDGETASKRNLPGQDLTSVTELRPYQNTDSYRQIHWKATAKRNELISKNPQDIEQYATVFFINNYRNPSKSNSLETEDKMMDAVVSAMAYCQHLGHLISLQYFPAENKDFTTDFHKLYQEIAVLPFINSQKFPDLINEYLMNGNICENVYIFSQEVDQDLIESMKSFRVLNSNVTLFLFGTASERSLRTLDAYEIKVVSDFI